MLFAMDFTGEAAVWSAILLGTGTLLGTAINAISTLLAARAKAKIDATRAEGDEYRLLLETQRRELMTIIESLRQENLQQAASMADQAKRVDDVRKELADVHKERLQCVKDYAELKGSYQLVQAQVTALQAGSKMPIGGESLVVADEKGVITLVSPMLFYILGWRPDQLEGKPITTLVPQREMEKHRAAWAKAVESNFSAVTPVRAVPTWALASNGDEVPVTLRLKVRRGEKGDVSIGALVSQRTKDA